MKKTYLFRIISTFILITLLIPHGIVFASQEISLYFNKAEKYIGQKSNNYDVYDSFVTLGNGAGVQYIAKVEKEGTYNIIINGRVENVSNIELTVGNDNIISYTLEKGESTGYVDNHIGSIELDKGSYVIKLINKNGSLRLNHIKFKKTEYVRNSFVKTSGAFKNHYLPVKVEAENFDYNSSVSDTRTAPKVQTYRKDSPFEIKKESGGNVLELNKGEAVTYTVICDKKGIYHIDVKAMDSGNLKLHFDGSVGYADVSLIPYKESSAGNVYFSRGTHKVTVVSGRDDLTLDYLRFAGGSGEYYTVDSLMDGGSVDIANDVVEEETNKVYKEIYVSPDGSDKGNGSKEKPLNSIDAARDMARKLSEKMSGDIVVNILPGNYPITRTLEFTEKDGGKNGYRIIYRGTDANNKPVLDGGSKISGWQKYNDNIYVAQTSDISDVRQLYINGYPAQRARSKYLYCADRAYDNEGTSCTQDGFYISKRNFPRITNVEDCEFVFNIYWVDQRVPVDKMLDLGDEYLFTYDQPHFGDRLSRTYTTTQPLAGNRFYIEHCPELLDEPGEYYFDKKTGKIYYYPFPEEDLNTAEVYTPKTEMLMKVKGTYDNRVENLSFDNIEFTRGAWNDASITGVEVFQADCIVMGDAKLSEGAKRVEMPAQVDFRFAKGIEITNCEFSNMGSNAIGMYQCVSESKVTGNQIHDISGSAISVGTWKIASKEEYLLDDVSNNVKIENNVIRRIGHDYKGSVGIGIYYSHAITAAHNDIKYTPYTGISLGWGWGDSLSDKIRCNNHKIMNNRIEKNGLSVFDGGAIYNLSNMTDTHICGNYIIDSHDSGCIYFDQGSDSIEAYNNVCEDSGSVIFAGNYMDRGYIHDNYANFVDVSDHRPWDYGLEELMHHEYPKRVEGYNWSDEAKAIIANAGVESNYKYLIDNMEMPSWRQLFMKEIPRNVYFSENIIQIMCTDYMPGGEGVGYHNGAPVPPERYGTQYKPSIGNTSHGEWVKYEVDIEETKDYSFMLHYSLAFDGSEPNYSDRAKVRIVVDGETFIDALPLEETGNWNAYVSFPLGVIRLDKGKHVIKLEFVDGGFSYEKIRLLSGNTTDNDATFDDGGIFKIK